MLFLLLLVVFLAFNFPVIIRKEPVARKVVRLCFSALFCLLLILPLLVKDYVGILVMLAYCSILGVAYLLFLVTKMDSAITAILKWFSSPAKPD
jgi:hypothetical protein